MPPPTILSLKQSFLTSQTTLLSTPPTPSEQFLTAAAAAANQDSNSDADSPALPPRAIDDALNKLAHILSQHSKRVHTPVATRHVAEQIDQLYWQAAERGVAEGSGGGVPGRGSDLTSTEIIQSIPPSCPLPVNPNLSDHYATLQSRLVALSTKRDATLAHLNRLQAIQSALTPLSPLLPSKKPYHSSNSDDTASQNQEENDAEAEENAIQSNLVTRNGEMERELEKMRVLLARVGGRVARLRGIGGAARREVEGVEEGEKRKVDEFLEEF